MASTLAQDSAVVRGERGRFSEKPLTAGGAETMNLQCAVLDLLKECGEASRILRSKADAIDRAIRRTSVAWAAHRDSIAAHERKALA